MVKVHSYTSITFLLLNEFLSPDVQAISSHSTNGIGIASYRRSYDDSVIQDTLIYGKADQFKFQRFQSPASIQKALRREGGEKKYYVGKDGRKGFVSSKKLGGDWVLARSEQVAVQTSTKEVLKAYLTAALQEKWNKKNIFDNCKFKAKNKYFY